MPSLKRVICHWAVTKYKCDDNSQDHYHFIYEGDGTEVAGRFKPEDNLSTSDGTYAAHTLHSNAGSIGVSCAAMFGAVDVDHPGNFPITEKQFEAMCKGVARLCKKYGIAVTDHTVLTHAEVQPVLGITQKGKWDISVLPHLKLKGVKACGDAIRASVSKHLTEI